MGEKKYSTQLGEGCQGSCGGALGITLGPPGVTPDVRSDDPGVGSDEPIVVKVLVNDMLLFFSESASLSSVGRSF